MSRLKILDCTLRDGGYVNEWRFGNKNIINILNKLNEASIDIIECGFLSNKVEEDKEISKFRTFENISTVLQNNIFRSELVCMINYGEYKLEDIPIYDGNSIDGIRVAFHKKDLKEALEFSKGILNKGYRLFIQPMVSASFTDNEFLNLIEKVNEINPYAFYIVDSFGVMRKSDLMRFFYLVDNNLNKEIYVGYHSHNNLQLSYSNAQALVDLKINRNLIIDSSVFGMGRGAGNLNTELFIEYLNEFNGANYKAKPLLQIIDQVLKNIYMSNYWGYSLSHYLSAKQNCHPNYATFLSYKDTLNAEDVSNILSIMDEKKKNNFDESYIENLYYSYQSNKINDEEYKKELKLIFRNKKIVVIAPGSSIKIEKEKIVNKIAMDSNTLVVSVNFIPEDIDIDYVFVSNLKRYEYLKDKIVEKAEQFIITSNIKSLKHQRYIINYIDLLNEVKGVSDNAGLMIIKLLIMLEVSEIALAGYDGYSYDSYDNYVDKDMTFVKIKSVVDLLNDGMKKVLSEFSGKKKISYITKTKYLEV